MDINILPTELYIIIIEYIFPIYIPDYNIIPSIEKLDEYNYKNFSLLEDGMCTILSLSNVNKKINKIVRNYGMNVLYFDNKILPNILKLYKPSYIIAPRDNLELLDYSNNNIYGVDIKYINYYKHQPDKICITMRMFFNGSKIPGIDKFLWYHRYDYPTIYMKEINNLHPFLAMRTLQRLRFDVCTVDGKKIVESVTSWLPKILKKKTKKEQQQLLDEFYNTILLLVHDEFLVLYVNAHPDILNKKKYGIYKTELWNFISEDNKMLMSYGKYVYTNIKEKLKELLYECKIMNKFRDGEEAN